MRVPNLSKWKRANGLIGLLFFAQLIDELLFDYTIDTYKVPALNSHLICYELLDAIDEIEGGYLEKGAINSIIEELQYNLRKDPVIKEILGLGHEEYIISLNTRDSLPVIKTKITYLKNRIENKYFETCKSLLKKYIWEQKEKKKINRLTRIFITELISKGYSPGYIYFENDRFFFTGAFPEKIDSLEVIDKYFERFNIKEKEWNIIFKGNKIFSSISKFIKKIDIEICETLPSLAFGDEPRVKEYLKENSSFPICLIAKKIKAFDPIKARQIAESRILAVDSLFKYHVHRRELCWKEEVLCYTTDERNFVVCKRPISPVMKRPDRPTEKLSKLVEETVSAITNEMLGEDSLEKLLRALRLHSIALKSNSPENQILNFWTAVEILLPPPKEDKSKIEQIANLLTPFIAKAYVAKLAADLCKSIKTTGKDAVGILEKIKIGDNEIDKCVALFSIKKNEKLRTELYKLFEWHPLLKNRIWFLMSKFNSARIIANTLNAHMQRISWQIRRIYRTRNLIIHSGKTLPYLSILVENLHSYLDRVFDLIQNKTTRSSHPLSIDEIALEIRLEHETHIKMLDRSGDLACTEENYKKLLFGS